MRVFSYCRTNDNTTVPTIKRASEERERSRRRQEEKEQHNSGSMYKEQYNYDDRP
jgi:hypothetical protein